MLTRLKIPSSIVTEKLRRMFYVGMSLTADPEEQKKGHVYVQFTVNNRVIEEAQTEHSRAESGWSIAKLAGNGLPVRFEGVHFCYNNLKVLPVMSCIQLGTNIFTRLRFRSHYGEHRLIFHKFHSCQSPLSCSLVAQDRIKSAF